ncbi:MAG: hypothetical protein WCP87_01920, partial [Atribacterota bacterium]
RKEPTPFPGEAKAFFFPFFLPLVIPYRLLERGLMNVVAGFVPVWAVNALMTGMELILLYAAVRFFSRPMKVVSRSFFFRICLLIGLGFGMGRWFRDVLLVWYHPLFIVYGYSQFSHFLNVFFHLQGVLQGLLDLMGAGFFALTITRGDTRQPTRTVVGFLLGGGLFKEIDTLIKVLFQFVPSFSFFASVYLISLLPLLLLAGFSLLWMAYRRWERKENTCQEK